MVHAHASAAGLALTVMWKPARSVVSMQTAAVVACATAACASVQESSARRAAAASMAPTRRVVKPRSARSMPHAMEKEGML
jgi:hypothetical protein